MDGRRIELDTEAGEAVVAGTRLSVRALLERLAEAGSFEGVLRDHPGLTPGDVSEALRFAAGAMPRDGGEGRPMAYDAATHEVMRYQLAFLQGVCGGLLDAATGRVSLDSLPAGGGLAGRGGPGTGTGREGR